MLCGEAEQGLERGHRRSAAVEAEDELVDVVRQVLGTDAMMGAEHQVLRLAKARWTRGRCLAAFFGSPITVGRC